MACIACGRGFHNECEDGCEECHGNDDRQVKAFVKSIGKGAPVKDPKDINDPYSTGRKRAAIKYPLFETNPCEWRGKKNCGGGLSPIIGCIDGLQKDRHHGPIKDPLHNELGNVHRICKHCHNRWHAANDSIYDEMRYADLPHIPELADELELLANDAYWKMKKV